jgi:hypothetical protein
MPLRCRGSCSRRIKRKTAAPEATFFVFLFYLFLISPFYYKCNMSPVLENYKRGGRGDTPERRRDDYTHLAKTTHIHTSSEETWDPFPLSKACNPYYEHSSARQHEQQNNLLDIGSFLPEPV